MMKTMLFNTGIAAGLVLVGLTQSSQAAIPAPTLALDSPQNALVEQAAWSCGPRADLMNPESF